MTSDLKARVLVSLTALVAIALTTSVAAQRGDLGIHQVSPSANPTVEQIGDLKGLHSPDITQVSHDPVPAPDVAANQLSSSRAGHDAAFGQLAPRNAGNVPTAQLADRNTRPGLAALPQGLVDACDRAARGRRPAPKGVDCSIVVEAAPPPVPVSAEQALLTTDNERDGQRVAAERLARGNAPDAGEVALRLSTGDLQNSPVAQAVAAQAAANALQQAQGTTAASGSVPVIVPGGSGATISQP